MRPTLIIVLLFLNGCSRRPEKETLQMHLVQTSYYSRNPDWGVISNPGSLVISIKSGRASGELLHIVKGKSIALGTFEFDAEKHTFLSSTSTIESGGPQDAVDVSFVRDADQDAQRQGGVEVKLGSLVQLSRTGDGQSIAEGSNVLYRIQRTELEQDRWRPAQEKTIQTLLEASKNLDCEYIVIDIKEQR